MAVEIPNALVFAATLLLGACTGLSSLSDSGIDARHDPNGKVVLLDTPRMWAQFAQLTDITIEHELAGNTHWGGYKSANDAWIHTIRANETGRENAQKYITYIIERRRAAGLPELVGYP
jgi:hypothetical protein